MLSNPKETHLVLVCYYLFHIFETGWAGVWDLIRPFLFNSQSIKAKTIKLQDLQYVQQSFF